jgi:hypothetical protein
MALLLVNINLMVVALVADPLHFNADPDPAFLFNVDPDPVFRFNADPDPSKQCEYATTGLRNLQRSRPFTAPFKPLKLLSVAFNAYSDPVPVPPFKSNANPDLVPSLYI